MIVATLLEPHLAALQEAIKACDATADAFEIRLDALDETIDPHVLRKLTPKPLIATVRRTTDGGASAAEPGERRRRLDSCLEAGFDYIDLELDEATPPQPTRAIRSQHDLRATPSTASLLRLASELPTDSVFKFAAKIRSFSDTLQLLAAARALQTQGRKHALMGLGDFPRALTHLFGSHLIYGGGRSNAPGQPAHTEIVQTLHHWGDPRPASRLLLVVGDPIGHSLSPRMHNAAAQNQGLHASYGALQVSNHTELQILLERAEALGLMGASVTSPLKDAAYELCGQRSPEAEAARAVNCIQFRNGAAVGHNTDGTGAAPIVQRLLNDDGRVLLIGTGGGARALASQWPAQQLTVAGRNADTLRQIAKRQGCRTIPLTMLPEELGNADLLVNATREEDPVPLGDYAGALFDYHYAPQPTAWERHAAENGLAFAGGRELLLEQGVRAFRIWTGEDPPTDLMRSALEPRR